MERPSIPPGYAAVHALPTATGASPRPCSARVDDLPVSVHLNPGLRPVLATGGQSDSYVPPILPCCWGCRVVSGPDWDFGDQDGKPGNVGIVQEPSRKVIREWIDEWAEGGHDSGWSPYKSVVVNWGKRGSYILLQTRGRRSLRCRPSSGLPRFVRMRWGRVLEGRQNVGHVACAEKAFHAG